MQVLVTILYLALTVAGLFIFKGIPILNVALGFPVGAIVAWHALHPRPVPCIPGCIAEAPHAPADPSAAPPFLRELLLWSLATSAATLVACGLEVGAALMVSAVYGGGGSLLHWLPILSPLEASGPARVLLLAALIAPALQVLTTVFGGVLVLALARDARDQNPDG